MKERIYYTDTEFVELDIPSEGNIGCMMSGGADSSLLCYLLAATIKKHSLKTKIVPITAEMLKRPYNIRVATDVLQKISELTDHRFDYHPCFAIPNHRESLKDEEKVEIKSKYTREFITSFSLSTIFTGITGNPPNSARIDTNRVHGHKERDDPQWIEEQLKRGSLSMPFVYIDKKNLAAIYKKYNLIEDLLPLTRSCEGESYETENFTKNCIEVLSEQDACWWCRERVYGFENRDLDQPKPFFQSYLENGEKITVQADSRISISIAGGGEFYIPYSKAWRKVLVQVSGGIDSTLLFYFLCKKFKELNLEIDIVPISFQIYSEIKNSINVYAIFDKVKDLIQYEHLEIPKIFNVPKSCVSESEVNKFIFEAIDSIMDDSISFEFNGGIKESEFEYSRFFKQNPENKKDIYTCDRSAWPLAKIERNEVIKLYDQESLIDSLLPLTTSCAATYDSIDGKPCGICWKCTRRKWGFSQCNIKDPGYILPILGNTSE